MLGRDQEGGTQAASEMEELLLRKSGRTQLTHTWTGRKVHADFQLWGCKSYRRVTPTPEPVEVALFPRSHKKLIQHPSGLRNKGKYTSFIRKIYIFFK